MNVDQNEAAIFLKYLDPAATSFTFQTFDDDQKRSAAYKVAHPDGMGDPKYTKVLNGTLAECWSALAQFNEIGAGVYVTINETDLKGRKKANVVRVRAVFIDLDGAPLEPVMANGRAPHIVTETSPGRWHAFWRTKDLPLDKFTTVQKTLIEQFGSDKKIIDLPRVMRLPGFEHRKGEPFLIKIKTTSAHEPFSAADFEKPKQTGRGLSDDPHDTKTPDQELIADIKSGAVYYGSLLALSARLIGRDEKTREETIKYLRSLMNESVGEHDGRWQARVALIPSLVDSAVKKKAPGGECPAAHQGRFDTRSQDRTGL
jgi:hypothetical protein